ncbi:WAS/WASL-interacting protein family member 3 [Iris pallida]|uniref:WAS/WASL-interacting protein family member 3 n=1 Tax=Iris pallida TaxID=29817 RepID=A0AAX6FI68_IRIPA|nr:WAS/WASL-interacting protein family member 3 [Iris pallida]
MGTSTTPPSPPPPPPSAGKRRLLRGIFPLVLAVNIAVGVYLYTRTSKKQSAEKDVDTKKQVPPPPVVSTEATVPEKTISTEMPAPVKALPPVPEHEQRELFKWILEEKRKVKPRDSLEKKKIDEEKALLKQVIRAKSIPSL